MAPTKYLQLQLLEAGDISSKTDCVPHQGGTVGTIFDLKSSGGGT